MCSANANANANSKPLERRRRRRRQVNYANGFLNCSRAARSLLFEYALKWSARPAEETFVLPAARCRPYGASWPFGRPCATDPASNCCSRFRFTFAMIDRYSSLWIYKLALHCGRQLRGLSPALPRSERLTCERAASFISLSFMGTRSGPKKVEKKIAALRLAGNRWLAKLELAAALANWPTAILRSYATAQGVFPAEAASSSKSDEWARCGRID